MVEFRPFSRLDQISPLNEESIPWAEIVESRPAGNSVYIEKLKWLFLGCGYPPVPVMLSVIMLVAIMLYFLAQQLY
ncbi:MAG: hypothetical protein NTW27_12575 [Deltaproteobacteria bacterium]|jgi:hypothetical protein|nr:hypothetical protein [Deltaproteobacteria bacterium]